MSAWQLIFLQSRANNGAYNGEGLAAQNWDWPQGTWFQKRLDYLRRREHPTTKLKYLSFRSTWKMKTLVSSSILQCRFRKSASLSCPIASFLSLPKDSWEDKVPRLYPPRLLNTA